MLEMAEIKPDDIVYDLGCGDARILITAVREFGARMAVGYEIREDLYKVAKSEVEQRGLQDKITIVNGNLFNADLSSATVITLYLTGSANDLLKPKLEREVKPQTRIVSRTFSMRGWKFSKQENFFGTSIYLYKAPEAFT
jgi:tRNA A58 N-methylase Trm61